MASKQTLIGGGPGGGQGGGLRAGPDDRTAPGASDAANQGYRDETGAQRGAFHPGDPGVDIDLLDDHARQGRRGMRSGIAIVAGLAVFVGILWFAYDWGMGQLEIVGLPVIVADNTPIKVRPADPGGIEVPNQNVAVLNDPVPDPQQPQSERLLPPPETPQPPQAAEPQTDAIAKVEELLGPPLETAAGPDTKMPTAENAQPPAATGPPVVPQVAAALPEVTPEPVLPEPPAEVVQSAPEPAEASAAAAPQVPAQVPTQAPAQVAALPAAQAGDYVVQLAALKAQASARPAWTRLQKAHPVLLGDRELAIQRVDLGDRGIFYRVRAGFFADRAGALALCNALKTRGQDCLVAKR